MAGAHSVPDTVLGIWAMAVNSVDICRLVRGRQDEDKICVCEKVTCATEEDGARKGLGVLANGGHFGLVQIVLEDLLRRCPLTDPWSCAGGSLACSRTSPCVC